MILILLFGISRRSWVPWISALFCTECLRKSSREALLSNAITELTQHKSCFFLRFFHIGKKRIRISTKRFVDCFRCIKENSRSAKCVNNNYITHYVSLTEKTNSKERTLKLHPSVKSLPIMALWKVSSLFRSCPFQNDGSPVSTFADRKTKWSSWWTQLNELHDAMTS